MSQMMCSPFPPYMMRPMDGDMRSFHERWRLGLGEFRQSVQPVTEKVDEPLDFSKKATPERCEELQDTKASPEHPSYRHFGRQQTSGSSSPISYTSSSILEQKTFDERQIDDQRSELCRRLTADDNDLRYKATNILSKTLSQLPSDRHLRMSSETKLERHNGIPGVQDSHRHLLTPVQSPAGDTKPVQSTILPANLPHASLGLLGGPSVVPTNSPVFGTNFPMMAAVNTMMNGDISLATTPTVSPLPSENQRKGSKPTRPFKAYNPIPQPYPMGLAMMPLGVNVMQDFEEQELRYQHFVKQMYGQPKLLEDKLGNGMVSNSKNNAFPGDSKPSAVSPGDSSRESPSTSGRVDSSPIQKMPAPNVEQSSDSNGSGQQLTPANINDMNAARNLAKKIRTLPEELKDAAYWERRKKNNEAAKRSRDSRRQKEDYIAIRARFLEDENKSLRVTNAILREELRTMKCCAAHHNRF